MNEELAMCAKINFENFERAFPRAASNPFYVIAKTQLDEALVGRSVEEVLQPRPEGKE